MSWLSELLKRFRGRPPVRPPVPPPPPPVPPSGNPTLDAINRVRAENGLRPFAENPCLTKQAQAWAAEMRRRGVMSHAGFQQRVAACPAVANAGEVVAAGYRTPYEAAVGWRRSPGHWDILGSAWDGCGAGFDGTYYAALCGDTNRFSTPFVVDPNELA